MLIDSHAHIFPSMGGSSGHASVQEHMRFIQQMLLFHHQPVKRNTDNAVVFDQHLFHDNNPSLEGLREVEFRGGSYGKFTWIVNNIEFSKQYLPPTLTTLAAPPELMIAQMDYVGIDKAVLQTGHSYGILNEYISKAVNRFPDRFWGLAMVDEWKIDDASQLKILEHSINELSLHGLWFQSSNLAAHKRYEMIDDPIFYPFWDRVREMGIPVYWFVNSIHPELEAYLVELRAFNRWNDRYADIQVVYTHGLPLSRFLNDGKIFIPKEVWHPLQASNVLVEILIPISQGSVWDYPYLEAQPVIEEFYERLGPYKLVWGSDMPNVERHCTYRQSLDYLRNHCGFIPDDHMALICGENVSRIFNSHNL